MSLVGIIHILVHQNLTQNFTHIYGNLKHVLLFLILHNLLEFLLISHGFKVRNVSHFRYGVLKPVDIQFII